MQIHSQTEHIAIRFQERDGCWEQEDILWEEGQLYAYGVLPCNGKPVFCKKEWCSMIYFEDAGLIEVEERHSCLAGNFLLNKNREVMVFPKMQGTVWIAILKEEFVDDLFRFQIADCPCIYEFLILNPLRRETLLFEHSTEGEIGLGAKLLRAQFEVYDVHSLKNIRTCLVLYFTLVERAQYQCKNLSTSKLSNELLAGEILQYLSHHYATATLSSTAKAFNYHPNYFSSLFHKLLQCGFSTKLQQIRLERAAFLLKSTNLTIEEIRIEIGFDEKSYFYRLFREKYGTTPAAWRKKNKKMV